MFNINRGITGSERHYWHYWMKFHVGCIVENTVMSLGYDNTGIVGESSVVFLKLFNRFDIFQVNFFNRRIIKYLEQQ